MGLSLTLTPLPCDPVCSAVDVVCREGPRYVLELAKFGAEVRG